jgi:hypothetical protein
MVPSAVGPPVPLVGATLFRVWELLAMVAALLRAWVLLVVVAAAL